MVERITNGGFETGDLTGWSVVTPGSWSVLNYYPHTGTYSVFVGAATSTNYLYQTVDLTDVDTLTFWQFDYDGIGVTGYVYIDTTLVKTFTYNTGDWTQESIDVSAYSGNHVIKFSPGAPQISTTTIDDISAIATASGWTHITKENSVLAASVSKTNGVLNTAIAKMNGVVV